MIIKLEIVHKKKSNVIVRLVDTPPPPSFLVYDTYYDGYPATCVLGMDLGISIRMLCNPFLSKMPVGMAQWHDSSNKRCDFIDGFPSTVLPLANYNEVKKTKVLETVNVSTTMTTDSDRVLRPYWHPHNVTRCVEVCHVSRICSPILSSAHHVDFKRDHPAVSTIARKVTITIVKELLLLSLASVGMCICWAAAGPHLGPPLGVVFVSWLAGAFDGRHA